MKVLYFAWLKQKIGCGEEELSPPESVRTVGQLVDWLISRGPGYAQAFRDRAAVRAAVDQVFADSATPLSGKREVAFFPPVTGG